MFFHRDIKGNKLPPKVLSLTYDDGPGQPGSDGAGANTRELGRFLFEEGIPATFFVVGRHAEGLSSLLGQLRDWGHLIGNHTYSHPGLVAAVQTGADIIGEIARTDRIIGNYVARSTRFLRAPYGNWREKKGPDSNEDDPFSVVADILNRSAQFPHYVGPMNWDISAADYDYWKRAAPATECARAYLDKIERIGRGIILMHDSSEEPEVRQRNRSLQTTKILVPRLKEKGYRFVRLDAIPQVKSAVRVSSQIAAGFRLPRLV